MKKPAIEAFKKVCKAKGGNITQIAEAFNVSRRTVHLWIEKDEKYRQAHEDMVESLVDLTEAQLFNMVRGIPNVIKDEEGRDKFVGWHERPDVACILFTLKTKGKNRGYVERQEVMNMDGNNFADILKRASQRKESAK